MILIVISAVVFLPQRKSPLVVETAPPSMLPSVSMTVAHEVAPASSSISPALARAVAAVGAFEDGTRNSLADLDADAVNFIDILQ